MAVIRPHTYLRIFLFCFLLSAYPLFGQSINEGTIILKKTIENYHGNANIGFTYNYKNQTIVDPKTWSVNELKQGWCMMSFDTSNYYSMNQNGLDSILDFYGVITMYPDDGVINYEKDYNRYGYNQLNQVLIYAQKAVLENSVKLEFSNLNSPFYIIKISSKDSLGFKKDQTLYIDTSTFTIRSFTGANTDALKWELSSFTMSNIAFDEDSIEVYLAANNTKRLPNENAFQLNRGMLQPGQIAPDFSLKNTNGDLVKLEDYKGKLILLDFWYAACKPCIKASYDIEDLREKYADQGLVIIGMNPIDKASKMERHIAKYDMSYLSLMCSRKVKDAYKIRTYPSFYLISESGIISYSISGYSTNLKNDLELAILQAISNRKP